MELNIKNKRVLVTGSSKGIGFGILNSFVNEGSVVIANSRNNDELKKITNELKCHSISADVSNPEQAKDLIEKSIELMGGLDILICNVGNGLSVPPGQESREEWERIFNMNFFSTTNIVEAARPYLKDSSGTIICISSICGTNIVNGAPITYSVAKAALNHYVQAISIPLAKDKVRINAIAAGNILFKGSSWEDKLKKDESGVLDMIKQNVPLNKFGDIADVANLTLYLSSPVSKFVTCSIFHVDGGQSCK